MPTTEHVNAPATGAAATLCYKTVDLDVKALGDDSGVGSYEVYAAHFNSIDRAGEKIAPGAFENVDEFIKDGFMALNHDWKSLPIATISTARQDQTGLLVTGDFHGHAEAQAARLVMRERLSRGKSVKASIGYVVTKDQQERSEAGIPYRLLQGIKIYELSLVNVPANPQAVAISVKGQPMEGVKTLSEGTDDSGGATVPTDTKPGKGAHVAWKPGKDKAGCGTVMAVHVKGMHGGHDATEANPIARIAACKSMDGGSDDDVMDKGADAALACKCSGECECGCGAKAKGPACKCMMTKSMVHHPVDKLETKAGTPKPMEDEKGIAPMTTTTVATVDSHSSTHMIATDLTTGEVTVNGVKYVPSIGMTSAPALSTKGKYLGDTDEVMAAAALDRIHSILGWALFAYVRSDKPLADVLAAAGGAIDEYRETVLGMLGALLDDESGEDESADTAASADWPRPYGSYSLGSMGSRAIATKYLAKLASFDTSRDGLVTGLSLETLSRDVVTAIGEIRDETRKHFAIRVKEGRALSSATRQRIQTVLDGVRPLTADLEALLAETEPKPKAEVPTGADDTATKALELRRLQLRFAAAMASA